MTFFASLGGAADRTMELARDQLSKQLNASAFAAGLERTEEDRGAVRTDKLARRQGDRMTLQKKSTKIHPRPFFLCQKLILNFRRGKK
jgi:hypothetical protein